MGLREQLDTDMKQAMRDKNQLRLDTIRMIKSAIKYKEVEPGASGLLDETGVLAVVTSEVKKRRDAIAEFEKAGRTDLVEKEQSELAVLQGYLPQQLSAAELELLVDGAVAEVGARTPKEMGAVMKVLQPKTAGRADNKAVAELVRRKLGGA